MLAGAIVGHYCRALIAHIHGGDVSATLDNATRNAISKLTHLHFLATERSKNKLTDIGEESNRIFVIGAPGLDDIFNQNLLSDRKIREKYKINFQQLFALVL